MLTVQVYSSYNTRKLYESLHTYFLPVVYELFNTPYHCDRLGGIRRKRCMNPLIHTHHLTSGKNSRWFHMNRKFNTRDPIYIQVIRHFKEQLATGILEAGQEIPSRRELASQLKINPNTVQRAYKEMEEEGLIYTERNLPSKITRDSSVIEAVREELLLSAVDSFIEAVRPIDVPLEELISLIKEKYESENKEQGGAE